MENETLFTQRPIIVGKIKDFAWDAMKDKWGCGALKLSQPTPLNNTENYFSTTISSAAPRPGSGLNIFTFVCVAGPPKAFISQTNR